MCVKAAPEPRCKSQHRLPMIPIKTESAWKGTSNCRTCGIRDMVLFADLTEDDFKMIHAPVDDLEFGVGASLFHEGAAAQGIFTLRAGMLKLVRNSADGRQRIVRVLRPGDVAGLEALAHARYDSDAVARNEADDWLADINFGTARARVRNFVLKMCGALEQLDKHGRLYRILNLQQPQLI